MFKTNFLLSLPGGSEWLIIILGFAIIIGLVVAIVMRSQKNKD
jgi:hypothetical protein